MRIPSFIVNLISESWCVNNCERDASALIVQFEFWERVSMTSSPPQARSYCLTNSGRLDLYTLFEMRVGWVINFLASKDRLVAECVDESCATY